MWLTQQNSKAVLGQVVWGESEAVIEQVEPCHFWKPLFLCAHREPFLARFRLFRHPGPTGPTVLRRELFVFALTWGRLRPCDPSFGPSLLHHMTFSCSTSSTSSLRWFFSAHLPTTSIPMTPRSPVHSLLPLRY